MRLTIISALVATLIGFVAVYASLTLSGNGEKKTDATNQEKYQKMQGERLRALIFH
jgi:Na+/H+ antiporter NhaB